MNHTALEVLSGKVKLEHKLKEIEIALEDQAALDWQRVYALKQSSWKAHVIDRPAVEAEIVRLTARIWTYQMVAEMIREAMV